MNRTKIEWCDYTWSPVTGCLNGCTYCFARRISQRFGRSFEPTFHPERLEQPLKVRKPARIFVCSMGELFGEWVPRHWITQVVETAWRSHWHTFLFLTKCPDRLADFDFPPNALVGATVDDARRTSIVLEQLYQAAAPRFVSFEPLLGPPEIRGDYDFYGLSWVIVGAMTGPGAKKHAPRPEWVQQVLDRADYYSIPVFMKDNLRPYWPGEWRQEWPTME